MIKPEDLKDVEKILETKELEFMTKMESIIDSELKKNWNGKEARVFKDYNLKYRGNYQRVDILVDLVIKKYSEFWNIKEERGEDDGPNRLGLDYWIFTKK